MVWLDRQNAQWEPERQRTGSLINLRGVGVSAGDEERTVGWGKEEEGCWEPAGRWEDGAFNLGYKTYRDGPAPYGEM